MIAPQSYTGALNLWAPKVNRIDQHEIKMTVIILESAIRVRISEFLNIFALGYTVMLFSSCLLSPFVIIRRLPVLPYCDHRRRRGH